MKSATRLAVGLAVSLASLGGVAQADPVICSVRWCNPVFYAVGTHPAGVALGDFNGDRWTDLAVTIQGSDKVSILLNSGAGAGFDAPIDIPMEAGSAPHSILSIDIDNDNDLDLVVGRSGKNDVQLLTNSGGVFSLGATTGVGGSLPGELAFGDLDGNGFADVVSSNRDSADISVMLNAAGVLAPGVPYPVGSGPLGLALADFDGEGSLDIAVASADTGSVDVLLNDGSGVLSVDSSLSVGPGLSPSGGVATGDFDGNGDLDIVVVTKGTAGDFATIFLNSGSAAFGSPSNFNSDETHPINDTGYPSALIANDFDLNGTVDLALTNLDSNRMGNLLGEGTGIFYPPMLFQDPETPEALAAADLDGNGSDDLVSANRDSENVGVMINSNILLADGFEWGDTWAWSAEVP